MEEEYESQTPYHRKLREENEPSPFTPTGFDDSVDIDAIIQETPKTIVRLIGPTINAVESANLHVLDGLNDGDARASEHHFSIARREIERAKRGLDGALSQINTYLAQIDIYLERRKEPETPTISCSVCGKAARFREENGSNFYCGPKCLRNKYKQ